MKGARTILVGLVAVVCAGCGFLLGRLTVDSDAGAAMKQEEHSMGTRAQYEGGISGGESPAAGELPSSRAASGKPRPLKSAAELVSALEQLERIGMGSSAMRQYMQLHERIAASDPKQLAAEVFAIASQPGAMQAAYLVIGAYAEMDPEGAWAFALGLPPGESRQAALNAAISALAQKDPESAMARLASMPDKQLQRQMKSMVIMQAAQKDPRRALGWVDAGDENEQHLVSTIFHTWSRKDEKAATAAAMALTGRAGEQARMALLSVLAEKDPLAAWQMAEGFPAGSPRGQDPRLAVIQSWSRQDAPAAAAAALSIDSSEARNPALSVSMRAWAEADFPAALTFATTVEDPVARAEALTALTRGPVKDREALFEAVLDHVPPGDAFQQAVGSLFSSWANDDPSAAAEAALQLPPGRVFSSATSQIASAWATKSQDLSEPYQWALGLPEGEARRTSLSNIMSQWAQRDPAAAARAADSLAGDDRGPALRQIAQTWSQKEPAQAMAWASRFPAGGERRGLLDQVMSQWAREAPEDAARQTLRMEEEEKSSTIGGVVRSWASRDTNAAAEWVRDLPSGKAKDSALGALTQRMAAEDPATALAWAAAISDAKARERHTENLAKDWLRHDAAAARTWIDTSQLPAETKARLLRR